MKKNPTSIVIIIDESGFYNPTFIKELTEKLLNRKIKILVGLVTKTKKTNSIEYYLYRNFYRLHLTELFIIGSKVIYFKLFKNILCYFDIFLSVEAVLKSKNINHFYIENDINNPSYLNKISEFKPDIIISSCSVIFKKKLLKIPKLGCINKHNALLPSYGGVYPVFNSIADGKDYTGVTIHKMTEKIDEGDILAQEKFYFEKKHLSCIYKKSFKISVKLILKAIKNLKKGRVIKCDEHPSYFSFPDKSRWVKFRKYGGRFY